MLAEYLPWGRYHCRSDLRTNAVKDCQSSHAPLLLISCRWVQVSDRRAGENSARLQGRCSYPLRSRCRRPLGCAERQRHLQVPGQQSTPASRAGSGRSARGHSIDVSPSIWTPVSSFRVVSEQPGVSLSAKTRAALLLWPRTYTACRLGGVRAEAFQRPRAKRQRSSLRSAVWALCVVAPAAPAYRSEWCPVGVLKIVEDVEELRQTRHCCSQGPWCTMFGESGLGSGGSGRPGDLRSTTSKLPQ
jgi:hypothetical protein